MPHCRYLIRCVFFFLDLACMGFHVFLFYHGMRYSMCYNIFILALPFPHSFDEIGTLVQFVLDDPIGLKGAWVGSQN